MNLVMQFRKVCNHPELFERNIGKVPFISRDLVLSRTSTFINSTLVPELRTDTNNGIVYNIPKLIYDECFENAYFRLGKYSIFNNKYIVEDLTDENKNFNSLFNFIGLLKFSINDFLNLIKMDSIISQLCFYHYLNEQSIRNNYYRNRNAPNIELDFAMDIDLSPSFLKDKHEPINIFINRNLYSINEELQFFYSKPPISDPNKKPIDSPLIVNSIIEHKNKLYKEFRIHRFYIPKVISLPFDISCSSKAFYNDFSYVNNNLTVNKFLYGKGFNQMLGNISFSKPIYQYFNFNQIMSNPYLESHLENGLIKNLFYKYEGFSQIELPSFERLVADCAKLKKLDELLIRLKQENHRVLIFCQMTRMIDILEEYMAKRRYTYFRMDGSTNIADRRDMVNEFQVNDKIFAFLLSTRAGGLGVNLTGADTVVFYDNDWNPTMDAQATDRAHRIGQTKVVSVYRLITKGTIEERILKRAKQKQNVQTTVYSGGAFKADIFKQSEIVELLYSEEEVKKMEAERKKLILESNDINIVGNNTLEKSEQANTIKGGKKKGKKNKKETPSKDKGKKNKAQEKTEDKGTGSLEETKINQGYVGRSIFSVTSSSNNNKSKINALKVDS